MNNTLDTNIKEVAQKTEGASILDFLQSDKPQILECNITNNEISIPIKVKRYLTAKEAIDFIDMVINGTFDLIQNEDDESVNGQELNPYNKNLYYVAAIIRFYTDISEQMEDITLEQCWRLYYSTDLKERIEENVNKNQLIDIKASIDKYIDYLINKKIKTLNNVSENMVSAFAGFALDLSSIIDKINDFADKFEAQALDSNGEFNMSNIIDIINKFKDISKDDIAETIVRIREEQSDSEPNETLT